MEECQELIYTVNELDTIRFWNTKGQNLIYCTSKKKVAAQTQTQLNIQSRWWLLKPWHWYKRHKSSIFIFNVNMIHNGQELVYHPLTEAQECMLAHGPNFAWMPRCPPNEEYIMTVEPCMFQTKSRRADELKVEVRICLKENSFQNEHQKGERNWERMTLGWFWLQIKG